MNAPVLARYEIANALTKQAATGNLSDEALDEAWDILDELPVVYHPLREGPRVVRAALTLQRRSAYDAAYLALAEDPYSEDDKDRLVSISKTQAITPALRVLSQVFAKIRGS